MQSKIGTIFTFFHVYLTCTVKHDVFGGEADNGLDCWLRKTKEWYCNRALDMFDRGTEVKDVFKVKKVAVMPNMSGRERGDYDQTEGLPNGQRPTWREKEHGMVKWRDNKACVSFTWMESLKDIVRYMWKTGNLQILPVYLLASTWAESMAWPCLCGWRRERVIELGLLPFTHLQMQCLCWVWVVVSAGKLFFKKFKAYLVPITK